MRFIVYRATLFGMVEVTSLEATTRKRAEQMLRRRRELARWRSEFQVRRTDHLLLVREFGHPVHGETGVVE